MKKPPTLAQRLRAWQGTRTAEQAAETLGVNLRTYENWLQARRTPRGLALKALLDLLKS